MIPVPGTTSGVLWFKELISSEWQKIPLNDINNYSIRLDDLTRIDDQSLQLGMLMQGSYTKTLLHNKLQAPQDYYHHVFPKTYTSSGGNFLYMSDDNLYLGLNGLTVLVESGFKSISKMKVIF
ncbi:hypothetical protein MNB_SM-4-607 [hydrothermal vent metagenome]|uniref:Uncharacterized protein n=1 Tax=hydrothermal vent metagenome TaxID=652676 RepID=A0A1W1CWB9_9ZZZZ